VAEPVQDRSRFQRCHAPLDRTCFLVSLIVLRGQFLSQQRDLADAPMQTQALRNTQLDLRHVQPTAVPRNDVRCANVAAST